MLGVELRALYVFGYIRIKPLLVCPLKKELYSGKITLYSGGLVIVLQILAVFNNGFARRLLYVSCYQIRTETLYSLGVSFYSLWCSVNISSPTVEKVSGMVSPLIRYVPVPSSLKV